MAGGRPSPYDPTLHPEWARSLAADGADDQKIAEEMHFSRSTIAQWKKKHKEFREAVKRGKSPVDGEVKLAFKDKATGFFKKETRRIIDIDPATGETKSIRIEEYDRYYPPDTNAAYLWLKNRDSANWKDKPDIPTNAIEFQSTIKGLADLINHPAEDRELPE